MKLIDANLNSTLAIMLHNLSIFFKQIVANANAGKKNQLIDICSQRLIELSFDHESN